jgi:hypothetical protein
MLEVRIDRRFSRIFKESSFNNLEFIVFYYNKDGFSHLWIIKRLTYALVLRGLACVPSRNPLRNLRRTTFKYRQRPVPVVRRRLALTDQLSKKDTK